MTGVVHRTLAAALLFLLASAICVAVPSAVSAAPASVPVAFAPDASSRDAPEYMWTTNPGGQPAVVVFETNTQMVRYVPSFDGVQGALDAISEYFSCIDRVETAYEASVAGERVDLETWLAEGPERDKECQNSPASWNQNYAAIPSDGGTWPRELTQAKIKLRGSEGLSCGRSLNEEGIPTHETCSFKVLGKKTVLVEAPPGYVAPAVATEWAGDWYGAGGQVRFESQQGTWVASVISPLSLHDGCTWPAGPLWQAIGLDGSRMGVRQIDFATGECIPSATISTLEVQGSGASAALTACDSAGNCSDFVRIETSGTAVPAQSEAAALAPESPSDATLAEGSQDGSAQPASPGFREPSNFSKLANLDDWSADRSLASSAALALATATVLSLLVVFPTQLLMTAIAENRDVLLARVRRRSSPPANGEDAPADDAKPGWGWFMRKQSGWATVPWLLAASVIVAFSNSNFGLNGQTLRLVLSAMLAFLLLDVAMVLLGWLSVPKQERGHLPRLTVRPVLILAVLATVLLARVSFVQPAIVFGALLIADWAVPVRSTRALRLAGVLAAVSVTVGVGAWLVYSFTETGVLVHEFASMLTVDALSTLPIVLLPLVFMAGLPLWKWNRAAWVALYTLSGALFILALIPLPSSWTDITEPLALWIGLYIAYCLLAIGTWAIMRHLFRGLDAVPELTAAASTAADRTEP